MSKYRNKEWLQQKYWEEELTIKQVARLAGCSRTTIQGWMKKLSVPARGCSESTSLAWQRSHSDGLYRNEKWIRQKYWEEELTIQEIMVLAKCGENTLRTQMKKLGIPMRTRPEIAAAVQKRKRGTELYHNAEWLEQKYWQERLSLEKIAETLGCSPQTILNNMERLGILRRPYTEKSRVLPRPSKQWLHDKYQKENLTAEEIGELLGCSSDPVYGWMTEFNIPRRSQSECSKVAWRKGKYDGRKFSDEGRERKSLAIKRAYANGAYDHIDRSALVSGENNPNWRGGISAKGYPYTFDDEFKELVRQRDGYKCAICGLAGRQVHHIDYDKENTVLENCITLCRSCHCATNFNRDYWQRVLSGVILAREAIQGTLPLFPSEKGD